MFAAHLAVLLGFSSACADKKSTFSRLSRQYSWADLYLRTLESYHSSFARPWRTKGTLEIGEVFWESGLLRKNFLSSEFPEPFSFPTVCFDKSRSRGCLDDVISWSQGPRLMDTLTYSLKNLWHAARKRFSEVYDWEESKNEREKRIRSRGGRGRLAEW
jgi:hypothetical protein